MTNIDCDCNTLEMLSQRHLINRVINQVHADRVVSARDLPQEVGRMRRELAESEQRCEQLSAMLEDEPGPVDKGEYASLWRVLSEAADQAAGGKGKERHAKDAEPFEDQKICEITRRVGIGYPLGQAIKKAVESTRLGDRGPDELLGAINYLAAAVIVMREEIDVGK